MKQSCCFGCRRFAGWNGWSRCRRWTGGFAAATWVVDLCAVIGGAPLLSPIYNPSTPYGDSVARVPVSPASLVQCFTDG